MIVLLSSSVVFGEKIVDKVEIVEQNFFNTYFLESIRKMVDSTDVSRVDTFNGKVEKLADMYLTNQKSNMNNVKWYDGKLIFREDKNPNINILSECMSRTGKHQMIGRLTIPDVGINVALFKSNAQEVVDGEDSAAYFKSGDTYLVADHWYSGFERIRDCKKGTIAYIDTGTKVTEYVCTEVILGHNTKNDLTDLNYVSVLEGRNPNGITLYTCVNGWKNIRIAFFELKW